MPKVTWEVTGTTQEKVGDVAVVTKRLVGHVDNSRCPRDQGRHPAHADDAGRRQRAGAGDDGVRLRRLWPAAGRTLEPRPRRRCPRRAAQGLAGGFGPFGPSWQPQVLAKGWGYAIIVPNSIQADNGAGLTRGIIGLCNKGQPRKPDDWGSLRAWAWGASRALDYFETDKAVDAKQVGIEGLSRYGKAALVAMAYDQRFAIGFIGSSGEGGAKLHRRNFGELVENLTGSGEYHWMAGNFLKYGGPLTPGDLPVDAHELIALCAPRPTFISYGASSGPAGRRAVGRPARQLHGGRRGRPGLPAARQKRPGHLGIPRGRDGDHRRRTRLPAAQGRPHHRPELADVPGVRRPLHQALAGGVDKRAMTVGGFSAWSFQAVRQEGTRRTGVIGLVLGLSPLPLGLFLMRYVAELRHLNFLP